MGGRRLEYRESFARTGKAPENEDAGMAETPNGCARPSWEGLGLGCSVPVHARLGEGTANQR